MAIKKFKPTSPGRRQMTSSTFEEITTSTPEKSLLAPAKKYRRPQQCRSDHQAAYRVVVTSSVIA